MHPTNPTTSTEAAEPGLGAVPVGVVRDAVDRRPEITPAYVETILCDVGRATGYREANDRFGTTAAALAADRQRCDAVLLDPAARRAEGAVLPGMEEAGLRAALAIVEPLCTHWHSAGDADLTEYGKGSVGQARHIRDTILARLAGTAAPRAGGDDAPAGMPTDRYPDPWKAPKRWELGIRNIVTILHGSRRPFEVKDIVEDVRALARRAMLGEEGIALDRYLDAADRLAALDPETNPDEPGGQAHADELRRLREELAERRAELDAARSPDAPAGAALTREAEGLRAAVVAYRHAKAAIEGLRPAPHRYYVEELAHADALSRANHAVAQAWVRVEVVLASTAGGDGCVAALAAAEQQVCDLSSAVDSMETEAARLATALAAAKTRAAALAEALRTARADALEEAAGIARRVVRQPLDTAEIHQAAVESAAAKIERDILALQPEQTP